MPTNRDEARYEALKQSIVDLGLIYGVEVDQGRVKVTFTLTTPGCPIGPQVNEQIEEFVGELDGVSTIESEMVFTPAWSHVMRVVTSACLPLFLF